MLMEDLSHFHLLGLFNFPFSDIQIYNIYFMLF